MNGSMSRTGPDWDHAANRNWVQPFQTRAGSRAARAIRAEMTAASFEYIEVVFNRTRRRSTLGSTGPMQVLED